MIEVANLREMCEILKMDLSTGRKYWRKWPHFFATDGRVSFAPSDSAMSSTKSGVSIRNYPHLRQNRTTIEPQIEPRLHQHMSDPWRAPRRSANNLGTRQIAAGYRHADHLPDCQGLRRCDQHGQARPDLDRDRADADSDHGAGCDFGDLAAGEERLGGN